MPIQFQEAGVHDVSKSNPRDIVYIKGNETTDGSIRFRFITTVPPDAPETEAHVELRATGVWNDTGLMFSAGSISLGRDLKVSAAGRFLETVDISSSISTPNKFLIPHIEFANVGEIEHAKMPVTDTFKQFPIFTGTPDGQVTGTTIGQIFTGITNRILERSNHEVGTIGATAEIQISFFAGVNNAGILFNRFNIPASDMVANTPLNIVFAEDFGIERSTIFQEFKSVNAISLKTIGGNIITEQEGHPLGTEDILLDNQVLTKGSDPDSITPADLDFVFAKDLSLVVNNLFPNQNP